ncbi:MAG TPA: hypothetical protein VFH88_14995, partial [Candidatus Krumholzibacteria bacterium]|nr:hypothetical protein [Candidatus Krumholzibacteria bacterium]
VTPPARLMRVFVDADHVDAALGALARDGFDASRNGHGVWVRIDPGEKAGPILCLARSDIRVKDFDLSPRTSEDSR